MKSRKKVLLEKSIPELKALFAEEYKILQNQNPFPDPIKWLDKQSKQNEADGKIGITLLTSLVDQDKPNNQDRKRAQLIVNNYIKKMNLHNKLIRETIKIRNTILRVEKLKATK